MHTRQMLDAFIDGEVDAATRLAIAEHLAACPACAALRADREAVVQRVRVEAPRYAAPAQLTRRIRQAIDIRADVPRGWNWLRAAAAASVIAVLGGVFGYYLGNSPAALPPYEAVVQSHVASLAPGARLLDVASADRHTVKPWLQGRIDFAPAVRDFAAQGYLLLGARLGPFGGHDGAAIVYQVRNHVINLFVWRAEGDAGPAPPAAARARGYALNTWVDGGLRYTAISDAEPGDLERFARLVREPPG